MNEDEIDPTAPVYTAYTRKVSGTTRKKPLKGKQKPITRSKEVKKKRKKSESSSTLKKKVQKLLRERAIERDGRCVLQQLDYLLPYAYKECGPFRSDGEVIVQAEHLVGRAHSESYANMDNIVLLCMRHHFFFKKQHGALYWEMIRQIIGPVRWEKVQKWESEQISQKTTRMYTQDWRDAITRLSK